MSEDTYSASLKELFWIVTLTIPFGVSDVFKSSCRGTHEGPAALQGQDLMSCKIPIFFDPLSLQKKAD